jgi:predicted RNase H-like HicB family nuclease
MNRETLAYHVILEDAGDGIWTAEIPALEGLCTKVTQGRGERGARAMAADALAGYIWLAKRDGLPIPRPDAVIPEPLTKKKPQVAKSTPIRTARKAIKARRKAA